MGFVVQQAAMFTYLIEILCFFIRQHQHRSKFFVLQNNIVERVVQLLDCPEHYLRLGKENFDPRENPSNEQQQLPFGSSDISLG
jgi:hypothetical protein